MFVAELEGLDATDGAARRLAGRAGRGARPPRPPNSPRHSAEMVEDDKLAGGVLNARSGALQASIVADVTADGDGVAPRSARTAT